MSQRYNLRKRRNIQDEEVEELKDFIDDDDTEYTPHVERNDFGLLIERIYTALKPYKIPKQKLTQILIAEIISYVESKGLTTSASTTSGGGASGDDGDEESEGSESDECESEGDDEKDLSPEEIEIFKNLKTQIEDEHPTLSKILSCEMSDDDKKRCLRLLDIMNSHESGSEEFYDAENKLRHTMKRGTVSKNMNEIEKELTDKISNTDSIKKQILDLEYGPREILYGKYLKLSEMSPTDPEYSTTKNQLDWYLKLPYNKTILASTAPTHSQMILNSQEKLNSELFGLQKIKKQLMLLFNDSLISEKAEKAIALLGPPGTGKTSIAKAFAKSIGLPFEQVSLGGAKDSSFLFGSDNVYIGSGPGIVVRMLCNLKYSNGIILFDEIDKIEDPGIQHALLHITDYVQNKEFRDKYLPDIKIDLSKIWFFFSMNNEELLDSALKDRLPIIRVDDYSFEEKVKIIRTYMLPNILENMGMKKDEITFSEESAHRIIHMCGDCSIDGGSGLRTIKNHIKNIVSNLNFNKTMTNKEIPKIVTSKMIEELIEKDNVNKKLSYFT